MYNLELVVYFRYQSQLIRNLRDFDHVIQVPPVVLVFLYQFNPVLS